MPNGQTQTPDQAGSESGEQSSWRDQTANYARQGSEYVSHGYQSVSSTLSEHPLSTVLAGFGLGLGVGLLIASTLSEPPRRKAWYELDIDTSSAEQFGRRMLDAISDSLPKSVSRHLQG